MSYFLVHYEYNISQTTISINEPLFLMGCKLAFVPSLPSWWPKDFDDPSDVSLSENEVKDILFDTIKEKWPSGCDVNLGVG